MREVMRTVIGSILVSGALVGCGGAAPRASTTPPAEAPPAVAPASGEAPALTDAICTSRAEEFGPFVLSELQVSQRYGKNAATYADAPSTKDKAIEVCGVPASYQWLKGTTCKDGSLAKQHGRSGSVGPGGRCGSIIDLYTVTCPEGNYDVYIDIYMCGPGESLF